MRHQGVADAAQRRSLLRDMGFFFAGVALGPALLTVIYRLTPTSVPLRVPDLILFGLLASMFFILRWRWLALGMFISASIWIVFIHWVTASVSPNW